MNSATLKIENLNKRFGHKVAVKSVSFQMKAGESVGLLGPNGAGKTTSFYMIAGFIEPTQGKIFLENKDLTDMPMHIRARMGITYLPQDASIFRNLTVRENILGVLELRQQFSSKEIREKCELLLEELHITRIASSMAYTLSGGERRRAEIARAMAMDPAFLLLDEPFAGIDPIAVAEIKKIIKKLQEKGVGILLTDHNVRDALDITDTSYILNLGRIIVSGRKEDIVANKLAQKIYLGDSFSS